MCALGITANKDLLHMCKHLPVCVSAPFYEHNHLETSFLVNKRSVTDNTHHLSADKAWAWCSLFRTAGSGFVFGSGLSFLGGNAAVDRAGSFSGVVDSGTKAKSSTMLKPPVAGDFGPRRAMPFNLDPDSDDDSSLVSLTADVCPRAVALQASARVLALTPALCSPKFLAETLNGTCAPCLTSGPMDDRVILGAGRLAAPCQRRPRRDVPSATAVARALCGQLVALSTPRMQCGSIFSQHIQALEHTRHS